MTDLWHFTCGHGRRGIGEAGLLRPHVHPMIPALGAVVWMTDDPDPDRYDVGLTSTMLRCDRMAYRYIAKPMLPVRWDTVRSRAARQVLEDLESFGRPDSWWLSFDPVFAQLDRSAP